MSSLVPFSYCPFLCSPLQQNSLKDLTSQDSLFSPPIMSPRSNQTFTTITTTSLPHTASPRSVISTLLSSMAKDQSSSHLMYLSDIWYSWSHSTSWECFLHLARGVTHWLPPLLAQPFPKPSTWFLGLFCFSALSLGISCFKYYLCVDDCQTILPHGPSPLKSWLIHPAIYSAIPFEMLFREKVSQNECAHNWTPDLPAILRFSSLSVSVNTIHPFTSSNQKSQI